MLDLYKNNAFRILGIPMDATYKVTERANRKLHSRAKANKLDQDKDKLGDPFEEIAEMERDEYTIQEAYVKLKEPKERFKQRIFWIKEEFVYQPINDLIEEYYDCLYEDTEVDIEIKHLTTVAFHSTLVFELEKEVEKIERTQDSNENYLDLDKLLEWEEMLKVWKELIKEDEFWNYLIDIEMNSSFQPRVNKEEINELRKNALNYVLNPIIDLVIKLLSLQRFEIAESILNEIYGVDFPNSIIDRLEEKVFGTIEDNLEDKANEIMNELKTLLSEDSIKKIDKKEYCGKAYKTYESEVLPIYNSIESMESLKKHIRLRIINMNDIIVDLLKRISISYHNDALDYEKVYEILLSASELAKDTITKKEIQKDIQTIVINYGENILEKFAIELKKILDWLEEEIENNDSNKEEKIKICDEAYKLYEENVVSMYEQICTKDIISKEVEKIAENLVVKFIRQLAVYYHNECEYYEASIHLLQQLIYSSKNKGLLEELNKDLEIVNEHFEQYKEQKLFYEISDKCKNIQKIINDITKNKYKEEKIIKTLNNLINEVHNDIIPILDQFREKDSNICCIASDSIAAILRNISIAFYNKVGDLSKSLVTLDLAFMFCKNKELAEKIIMETNSITIESKNQTNKNKSNKYFKRFFIAAFIIFGLFLLININDTPNNKKLQNDNEVTSSSENEYISNNQLLQDIKKGEEKLKLMEKDLQELNDTLDSYMEKIEKYEEEIESNKSLNISSNYETEQYNKYIEKYNKALSQYKSKYSEYEQLLNETNNKIKKYNSQR
ncbi:MAG: hypothetical protein FH751_02535 [Firmicutes bacterium]|nr:hypothetical protein [Bacillota bacterium]